MASQPVTLETFNLVHPDHYAELGYPHAIWTRLRREDPVSWWERTEGLPYWVITKHRDITEISTQPEKFLNGPRLVMQHLPEQRTDEFPPTLIQLDPPRHRVLRKLIQQHFHKTASARARLILGHWDSYRPLFRKVAPPLAVALTEPADQLQSTGSRT